MPRRLSQIGKNGMQVVMNVPDLLYGLKCKKNKKKKHEKSQHHLQQNLVCQRSISHIMIMQPEVVLTLNWVTAVAADCSSLHRSSNLACRSSNRSARLSTSSCRWVASTPCSPASFTRSPAAWRTDCSGFFSPPVSSRSAYILMPYHITNIWLLCTYQRSSITIRPPKMIKHAII